MISAVYYARIRERLAILAIGGALIASNTFAIAGSAIAAIVLGLPGNSTASIPCELLFLQPLIRAPLGDLDSGAESSEPARYSVELPASGGRT